MSLYGLHASSEEVGVKLLLLFEKLQALHEPIPRVYL